MTMVGKKLFKKALSFKKRHDPFELGTSSGSQLSPAEDGTDQHVEPGHRSSGSLPPLDEDGNKRDEGVEVVAARSVPFGGAAVAGDTRPPPPPRPQSHALLPGGVSPGRDGSFGSGLGNFHRDTSSPPGSRRDSGGSAGNDSADGAPQSPQSSENDHCNYTAGGSQTLLTRSVNKAILGAVSSVPVGGGPVLGGVSGLGGHHKKPHGHARSATFPSSSSIPPSAPMGQPRGRRQQRPRRASYAINDLKIDSSTQWGEGVAVIESILLPGSATAESLSPEQRLGLRNVQMLLLRHGSDGSGGRAHIPRALLGSLDDTISEEGEDDDDDSRSMLAESSRYLLSHFGGVVRQKRSVEVTKKKIKSVVTAHTFMTQLMGSRSNSRLNDELFMPPEWERLPLQTREKLVQKLNWDALAKWDFNVIELSELSGGNPLLFLGWAVLGSPRSIKHMNESAGGEKITPEQIKGYNFMTEFNFDEETLCNFLRAMESEYDQTNPYHNNIHAADVLQTMHSLLQMGGKEFSTADIQTFSILLAAVVHDVGHPGHNNAYQVNAKSELAFTYNDISVLENMHVSKAFSLIMGENHDRKINILKGLRPAQIASVRKIIIDAVLHTDMTKHFTMVDQMKGLLVSSDLEEIKKDHPLEVLNYMLHLADVSNPAKPAPMFLEWTDRCLKEFFAQGDLEREKNLPISPLCDREKTSRKQSQIGFVTYVVEPAYEVMAKAMPNLEEVVMPVIEANLSYWKSLPEDKPKAKSSSKPEEKKKKWAKVEVNKEEKREAEAEKKTTDDETTKAKAEEKKEGKGEAGAENKNMAEDEKLKGEVGEDEKAGEVMDDGGKRDVDTGGDDGETSIMKRKKSKPKEAGAVPKERPESDAVVVNGSS